MEIVLFSARSSRSVGIRVDPRPAVDYVHHFAIWVEIGDRFDHLLVGDASLLHKTDLIARERGKTSAFRVRPSAMPWGLTMGWLHRERVALLRGWCQHRAGKRLWLLNFAAARNAASEGRDLVRVTEGGRAGGKRRTHTARLDRGGNDKLARVGSTELPVFVHVVDQLPLGSKTLPHEELLRPVEDVPAVGGAPELLLVVEGEELGSVRTQRVHEVAHADARVGVLEPNSHQAQILATNVEDGGQLLVPVEPCDHVEGELG